MGRGVASRFLSCRVLERLRFKGQAEVWLGWCLNTIEGGLALTRPCLYASFSPC